MRSGCIFLILGIAFAVQIASAQAPSSLKVLHMNLWQEGTKVQNGFEIIVQNVIQADADLVSFCEIRNTGGEDFIAKLLSSLMQRGHQYFGNRSKDTGIISKFQLLDFKRMEDHGSVTRARILVDKIQLVFYAGHLDYRFYAPYMPRGYDAYSWKKMKIPITNPLEILRVNLESRRDELLASFMEDADGYLDNSHLVIYCGDNNEPSHLDWTTETKDLFDHNGVELTWNASKVLEEAGYVDAYRQIYSNPVDFPGFTWPSDNLLAEVHELTYTPDADERDRIDYCYYNSDPRIEVKSARIFGPMSSIVRGERIEEESKDPFIVPEAGWPSDHKGLLFDFEINYK